MLVAEGIQISCRDLTAYQKQVRCHWDDEKETWYFSIVDVVGVLTDSENPNNYWKVLKNRLKKEGSELVTNCNQLKMVSSDGKFYKTDVNKRCILFDKLENSRIRIFVSICMINYVKYMHF